MLTVTAAGTAPLSYQWRKENLDILNATGSSLILNGVSLADAGNYTVCITNDYGTVTSSIATLSVIVPPTILLQPQSRNTNVGSSVTFTVLASGSSPLAYQWEKNGQALVGATLNAFTLGNVQNDDSGNYSVYVSNAAGGATSSNAVLNVGIAPIITSQPVAATGPVGGTASFSVTATGLPLNYQWLKGGIRIPGATNSTLTFNNLVSTNAGSYSVAVSNFLQTVTSGSASLTVTVPPIITVQPQSQTVGVGGNASFSVTATNATGYSWFKDGISVQTSGSTLNISSATTNNAGNYTVIVSGNGSSVTSSVAVLTVVVAPVITLQPKNYITNVGATVTLIVAASGTSPFSYQWRKDGSNIPNATINTLTLGNLQITDSGAYTVYVSNPAGGMISSNAQLTVGAVTPNIVTQPVATTAPIGGSASLSVTATGSPLYYQWFKNSIAIPDATNAVLNFNNLVSTNTGSYFVIVYNPIRSVTSITASLSVASVWPSITTQPQSQTVGVGGTAIFTVVASNAISYTWRKDGITVFSGQPSYSITGVTTNHAGSYTVLIGGSSGSITSSIATLSVMVPPVITLQPKNYNTNVGATVTLAASATGTLPLSYQWRKGGLDLPNATLSSLTLGNLQTDATGIYTVYVSNPAGGVISSNASLNVGITPAITAQPTSLTVTQGQSASFSVTATGTPLNYFWRKNGANISGGTNSTFVIPSTLATDAANYLVLVSNFLGTVTSVSVPLTVLVPVNITIQPVSRVVGEGSNTTLSVTSTGTSPRYQWYKGGVLIVGATGSTYALNNVQFADEANYTVIVSNTINSVTSQVATLTVQRFLPAITTQPISQSIPVGGDVTFTVEATGTTLNYQWQKDGTNLLDAITSQLLITNVSFADAAGYSVIITNPVGSVTSSIASLSVGFAPGITQQPVSQMVPVGSNALFIVQASGSAPLNYQWLKDGVPLLSQTNASLLLPGTVPADIAAYSVTVSSPFGSITSSSANLTLQFPPQIVQQPIGAIRPVGSNFTFTVYSIGTDPIYYQWRKDGQSVSGATATNYAVTNLTLADAGLYTVTVSNFLGSVTSSIANLNVGYPPAIILNPIAANIPVGGTAQFNADASGAVPLNYQWLKDGQPLAIGTGKTLTLNSVTTNDIGQYSILVSNQFGVALSLTAPLSLQYPPQITQQPIGGLQLIGSNFTFSVTATGTDPLNYQWQFYGTNIIDANSTNLIRTNLSLADSGVYSVVVSNFLGSVTSSVASLNVVSVMPQVYYGFNLYGNWSQYLYSYTNAEVYSEQSAGTATYWRPTVAGTEGDIIYRFPFVNPLAQATLTAGIAVWTTGDAFPYDPDATAYLDVSPDGTNWTNLDGRYANHGGGSQGPYDITPYIQNSKEVWVRARLTGTTTWPGDGLIFSQFLRIGQGDTNDTLRLDAVMKSSLAGFVTLGNLNQTYDGTARSVSTATSPVGLAVNVTYNGAITAPTNAGNYTVVGAINDLLYQGRVTNTLVVKPMAAVLRSPTILSNHAIQFAFTNSPNANFSVLSSSNLSLPLSSWTDAGSVTETAPGQYQFTDLQATNAGPRFYRLKSP